MSEFVTTMRCGIEQAQSALMAAHLAGRLDEVRAHRARLRDLLAVAEDAGLDATAWVDPLVLVTLGEE